MLSLLCGSNGLRASGEPQTHIEPIHLFFVKPVKINLKSSFFCVLPELLMSLLQDRICFELTLLLCACLIYYGVYCLSDKEVFVS